MGPAGPAVLRDVLVPSGAGVVDAVDISPVPAFWERRDIQVLVRPGVGSAQRQKGISLVTEPYVFRRMKGR